jgi:hypothetical protein
MTNVENQMSKEIEMPKCQIRMFNVACGIRHLAFVLLSTFEIRHSSFLLRQLRLPLAQQRERVKRPELVDVDLANLVQERMFGRCEQREL